MEALLKLLQDHYDQLPPKQRKVADVILQSPAASSYSTAAELAAAAGVTQTTVVRFCQGLGFPGYAEFRSRLRGPNTLDYLWPLDEIRDRGAETDETAALASLRRDLHNLQQLFTPEFQQDLSSAVAAIVAAERILIISSGSNAAVGLMLAHKLTLIGRMAQLENRGGSYMGQAVALLTPRDLLISTTFWQAQSQMVRALAWCREQGIPTLSITNSPLSPMARTAAHRLVVPTEGVSFFRSLTAPIAAVSALLSAVASVDRERTMAGIARAQSVWEETGIFATDDKKE